jgi:hypothetical protein
MKIDPEYLRQHYASLSDDALLEIDGSELVETARTILEAEVSRRNLGKGDPTVAGGKPEWLEEAAEVVAYAMRPDGQPPQAATHACEVLEAAGIPHYLETSEVPQEENASGTPETLLRLLVPGTLGLRATSVLERDIFNDEFEGTWRGHLETLSNAEVLEMTPEFVFCGLYDRIERVNKVYDEEIARRRLETDR